MGKQEEMRLHHGARAAGVVCFRMVIVTLMSEGAHRDGREMGAQTISEDEA